MNETATLYPPAKINLFLDVGPLRDDGYHDITSVFQTIDLKDCLEIRPARHFQITCDDASLPCNSKNTLWKAYEGFKSLCPQTPTLSLHLEKKIPTEAGLGGGSSDAGIFLQYLWKTFAPRMPKEKLLDLAARVGSDVPFFLFGGTAGVHGRGEQVTSLPPLPPYPVLLFHPKVAVSTAKAYAMLDEKPDRPHPPVEPMRSAVREGDWKSVLELLFNSFEETVIPAHSILYEIRRFCTREHSFAVLLSGSGSNLFVLDSEKGRLEELQKQAQVRFPEVATTLTFTEESARGEPTHGL